MILSYSYYNFPQRKGIIFFHQKTWTSTAQSTLSRIFQLYYETIQHITHDQDSTRIQSEDDLGDAEIQLLESAKTRTLRGLPQNSLYWGSEMFFLHAARGHTYIKIPKWLQLFRKQNNEFHTLQFNEKWSKIENTGPTTFFLTLKNSSQKPYRIMNLKKETLRISTHISLNRTECLPLLTFDLPEEIQQ